VTREDDEDGPLVECASPPCSLHELDPAFAGLEGVADLPQGAGDAGRIRQPPALFPLQTTGTDMADLYLKKLESERKALWATCRLKGLAKDTPERRRIAELDELLRAHKEKARG